MKNRNRLVFVMTELRGGLGVIQGFLRVSREHSVAVHGKRGVLHHIILEHKEKYRVICKKYHKFYSFLEFNDT